MLRPRFLALGLVLTCFVRSGAARADDAPPAQAPISTYAIVVGSNAGGPGQTDLRYAEVDARRVGKFLVELGGHSADQVDVIVAPTPDLVRARVDALAQRVHADLAAGKKARVFFYYSGHARATALDLGNAQLPLAELRTRLFSVPAHLTVVVLDACQSGAFSRVKGAAPAADFSFNSKHQLDASGIAVLASSSGSELSQESEQLRSSYFTHHLLVGMRGAGDANRDGQVSIDEAYRYAYHQTLLATAETAVGGQHVSLEVDLKGHGEVPMSFPRAATSSIELPAVLEGKTLVEDRRAKVVVAETYKAKGAAVRIAVAPGQYQVLVRQGTRLSRCQVDAGPGGTAVDMDRCTTESVVVAAAKGGTMGFLRPTRIEVTIGTGAENHDGYTDTLAAFGYEETGALSMTTDYQLGVKRQLERRLWVGVAGSYSEAPGWERIDTLTNLSIKWTTSTLGVLVEGHQPFASEGALSRLSVYGRLGAGLSAARTTFDDADDKISHEWFFGPAFSAAAGLHGESPYLFGLGVSIGYQFDHARALENLDDDTHASGGHRINFGVSYSY